MSYTLEDIVKALHHRQSQERQQQQQQQQHVYRQSPQYRIVSGYNFNPYQSIYAGHLDDDESEDGDYYPKYPAYYGIPNSHQFVRQQASGKCQESQESQGTQPAYVQGGDLFELLARLAGAATADDEGGPSNDEGKKGQAKSKDKDTKEEEVNARDAQSQTPTSTAGSVPKLKKTHSTAQFQDPKPKIELSSRNIRDPSIPYSPQINLYESHDSYDIVLAIPGASIKNLDIDFHPGTNELVVKGNVPNVSDVLGAPSSTSTEFVSKVDEIRTGSIERRIKFPNLPKIVDEQIKAKYINGLLTIKVPKNLETEKEKVKRSVIIEDVPDEAF